MMCYSDRELVKAELGELTLNQLSSLNAHAAACCRCAEARQSIRQLTEDLGHSPLPTEDADFVVRVMSARSNAAPLIAAPRRGHVAWFATAALVLLAAGAAKLAGHDSGSKETWTARGHRGGAETSLHAPASEVMVVRGSQLVALSGLSLSATDAFAVRYVNPTADTQYLAAFAVDATGAVHWIFPEYVDAATDPSSIPLPSTQAEQLLPQMVSPEKPAHGPMRVFTLTSREPATVKRLESAVREASPRLPIARALARLYPNALIREWSCSWN